MATDPNKKTLRHFQCRDYLWETFEQMSAELECSVDYLINEAMRQYARSRSYGNRGAGSNTGSITAPAPGVPESAPPGPASLRGPTFPPTRRPGTPSMPTAPPRTGALPSVPAGPAGGGPRIPSLPTTGLPPARPPGTPALPLTAQRGNTVGPPTGGAASASAQQQQMLARGTVPPPLPAGSRPGPNHATSGSVAGARVPAMPMPMPTPPSPPASQPPAPRSVPPPAGEATLPGGVLTVMYQGERYTVERDEFVIGRGQKTSDLVIKDSNVSRRHAVVVRHNGQYWIVDQQSTNGVEYMGAKIERKRIDDGDIFKICDYELTFTYR